MELKEMEAALEAVLFAAGEPVEIVFERYAPSGNSFIISLRPGIRSFVLISFHIRAGRTGAPFSSRVTRVCICPVTPMPFIFPAGYFSNSRLMAFIIQSYHIIGSISLYPCSG